MYKSKLQEVCQKKGWGLPEYETKRTGPDHMARFTASVKIKGVDLFFETPNHFTSSKEAQNTAANLAFDHISTNLIHNTPNSNPNPNPSINLNNAAAYPVAPLPNSLPTPSPGLVVVGKKSEENGDVANIPNAGLSIGVASKGFVTGNLLGDANIGNVSRDDTEDNACYRVSIGTHDRASKDTLHMYKNRLQQYGQKKNLGFPKYTAQAEGPPHNRRFKSRVSLDGKSYETLEFFTTLKEAEQAAAKVACQLLSVDAHQEDGSLYKNLLQQLAQKMNLPCPYYETASRGMSHQPVFESSVEVGSDTFRGEAALTKKQAEMNAAKAAYLALSECCQAKESSSASSIASIAVNDNLNQLSDVVKQQRQDATFEEVQAHAKKLKSRIENTYSPGPSNGDLSLRFSSPSENATALSSGQTRPQVKTVVFPRSLNLPVPENATVMPYSDDRFVAYKVGVPKSSA